MTVEQREKLFALRRALDGLVSRIADTPSVVNEYVAAVREWTPGAYAVGNVRQHVGIPYKCVQAHDSTATPARTPDTTHALWVQYHGTSRETARAWVAPSGAHDMYKAGEYMIWTDGNIYRCIADTVYSPGAYSRAWEAQS